MTTEKTLDLATLNAWIGEMWDAEIVPALTEYIRIPNKSADFDADWKQHGYMDQAVSLIQDWCKKFALPGMTVETVCLEGRSPLIFMEIPGQSDDTILLYGHLDKQPEMTGWADDLGPWLPVLKEGRLYGRGGADDGYAAFASIIAVKALVEQGIPHSRCVVLIESGEESGSPDLAAYVDHLSERIGTPSLIVCLDSGCGDYERLWCTTSLRGLVGGPLRVDILTEGVHSGDASGIAPSSFRIQRQLLTRLEDENTGEVKVPEFHREIPDQYVRQAQGVAAVLEGAVYDKFPWLEGAHPVTDDLAALVLNRTWRPTLSITGADGLPSVPDGGNVLRPFTTLKLSFRLPPGVDSAKAAARVKEIVETNPPYGARVQFHAEFADGWAAPVLAPWLETALDEASRTFFGKPPVYMGEGGSIPFMGMLGARYPEAQFLITGVLGPASNAHGPNEFLDIATGKRVTACVSHVVARHFHRKRG